MTYLPDVNVWIAMFSPGHVHNATALTWFERSAASDVLFCRVTQMGLPRLLTNHHVMGINTLTPHAAWLALDAFLENARIFFSKEPPGLEDAWRAIMHQAESGSNYLTAFANQAGVTLGSFNAQLARGSTGTLLLR